PVFLLLAGAGVYTGILYMRNRRRSRGSVILGVGFLLWGLHLLAFPLADESTALMALAYLMSAILALLIVVGMVVEDNVHLFEVDYHGLFNASAEAFFLLDSRTLRVIEANKSAFSLTGRTAEQLVGHEFLEFCSGLQPSSGAADAGTITAAIN